MHGNRPPGSKILKNFVRNVLTCADFSKISAQKLYIIMRWNALKDAKLSQKMSWKP